MNEEIRKNEIPEEQLEGVSGGSIYDGICPKCGSGLLASVIGGQDVKVCESCSFTTSETMRSISKGQ